MCGRLAILLILPVCLSTSSTDNIDFVLNAVAAFFIIEIDDLMDPKVFKEQAQLTFECHNSTEEAQLIFEHHNSTEEAPKNVKELFEGQYWGWGTIYYWYWRQ